MISKLFRVLGRYCNYINKIHANIASTTVNMEIGLAIFNHLVWTCSWYIGGAWDVYTSGKSLCLSSTTYLKKQFLSVHVLMLFAKLVVSPMIIIPSESLIPTITEQNNVFAQHSVKPLAHFFDGMFFEWPRDDKENKYPLLSILYNKNNNCIVVIVKTILIFKIFGSI